MTVDKDRKKEGKSRCKDCALADANDELIPSHVSPVLIIWGSGGGLSNENVLTNKYLQGL